MYPESNYPLQPEKSKMNKKKLLVIGVSALLAIVIIIAILIPRPTILQYNLTKTNLKADQNFGYISGSDVYAFNGLAFYKTNLNDDKVTILNSGNRLPVPNKVFWADSKGALMNFSSSFMLSKVEDALRAKGQQVNYATNDYTWYLDFKSGDLQLVDTRPIVADLAYYSEKTNGFYYVIDKSDELGIITPLHFYDVEKGINKTISEDLRVTDMKSMHPCPLDGDVCFTARDSTDTVKKRLYSIKSGEEKKVITESTGYIFSTNNPALYVIVSPKETQSAADPRTTEDADISYEDINVYDVRTKTARKLDFKISNDDPMLHFTSDKQFYVLKDGSEQSIGKATYRSGELIGNGSQSTTFSYAYGDGSAFNGLLNRVDSHGSGGAILATTLDDDQVVFGNTKNLQSFSSKSYTEANTIVRECVSSSAENSQYFDKTKMFRILFVVDDTFSQNIASFSQCILSKSPSALNGYNFEFAGVDPVNGRLSTD